jgi:glutaredoxin
MKLDVYSKEGCSYCVMVKKFLDRKEIPYNSYRLGENITLDEFKEKWPNVLGLPLVVADDVCIDDYKTFLENLDA